MSVRNVVILFVTAHLIIVIFNWLSLQHIHESIKADAKTINMVGQIRGGIQKACKEALAGQYTIESTRLINGNIEYLHRQLKGSFSDTLVERFNTLNNEWRSLETLITSFNNTPDQRDTLFRASEEIWKSADGLVGAIEKESDSKRSNIQYIFLVFFAEILIVLLVIRSTFKLINIKKTQEHLLMQQSKQAAMGELLSMIAHQWRQPLATIAAISSKMTIDNELDKLGHDQVRTDLDNIMLQTHHLSNTIDDFRSFFKPDRSKEQRTLAEVVEQAYVLVKKGMEAEGIEVALELDKTLKADVFSRELMQVVINILHNARQAMEKIDKTKRYIKIRLFEQEGRPELLICNKGSHIEEENLFRIFEPYFTTKKERNGTGLGLYMSKVIIEDHMQGRISAFNDYEGKGVCFRIVFRPVS